MNNIGSLGFGIEAKPAARIVTIGCRTASLRLGGGGRRISFGADDITQAKARFTWLTILSAALGLAAAPAHPAAGQEYPTRPIRLIVPFASGGAVDILARVVGQKLSDTFGQEVVVDNRAGAAGNIGATIAAKATPDGHTILMGEAAHAISASLYPKLPYNLAKDFAPVTLAAITPLLLVVHPTLPARSVKELIEIAKAKKGELLFGSGGVGAVGHLAGELFQIMAHVQFVHVPYKSIPPAIPDLLSGRIALMSLPMPVALPHVKTGKIVALAVTTAKRSPVLPEMPTVGELGLSGYDVSHWYGMLVPTGTPTHIIARLHAEIVRVLRVPEVAGLLSSQGSRIVASTPEEFALHIKQETARWAKVIKTAGVKPE